MNYLSMSITELHNALLNGDISPVELTKLAIEKAKIDDNNAFEYISEKEALTAAINLDPNKKDNLLWGIPYVLKDNFSTKDIPTTASSNILNGYIPVFDSEVYLRLQNEGAILIGKVTMDELAMGGKGMTGHLGKTFNPWDKTKQRIIGGSSCGSAAACAAGIVPLAIGSDTGDSVRKPAAFANLIGFKPTWGRISRYGLFPFAPSLDHVGFFTRNVVDSALTLFLLAGHDDKDATSSNVKVDDYLKAINQPIKGLRVAVIEEIYSLVKSEAIKESFENVLKKVKELGAVVNFVHVDIKLLRAIYPTYMILSSAEATSSYAGLDGLKFGPRHEGDNYLEFMFNNRTKGLSELIKRRFILGSYSLFKENQQDIFLRAQRCRNLINKTINSILEDNNVIYLPASPDVAPRFDEEIKDKLSDEYLILDNYLALANFGGQPSISLPLGFKDGLPYGANIIGRLFDESTVLKVAKKIEEIVKLNDLIPGGK